jgi:hypothetical protein
MSNQTVGLPHMAGMAGRGGGVRRFAPNHPWDRNFFATWLAAIWIGTIAGFGYDMVKKFEHGGLHYPWVIHIHAAVYVGWLALLTAQILLVRRGRVDLHRRMGQLALVLLPLMAVLGPAAALTMDRLQFSQPGTVSFRLPFLAIQFSNVLTSITLIVIGLARRRDPSAHKRLMLMGTLVLTEPGYSRFLFMPLYQVFGNGVLAFWLTDYFMTIVLMLGVGVYDLITRKRLHPAYAGALAFCLGTQLLSAWAFHLPAWRALTVHLVGH